MQQQGVGQELEAVLRNLKAMQRVLNEGETAPNAATSSPTTQHSIEDALDSFKAVRTRLHALRERRDP